MFDDKELFQNSKTFFLVLISFSTFFLFLNFFEVKNHIINLGELLVRPIDKIAISTSKSYQNVFGVFEEVKTLRTNYFDLQEKYLTLKAQNNMFLLLEEENLSLKKQLGLNNMSSEIILAEVLFQDWSLRNESLLINKGYKDGIKEGDIVSVGLMYVGIVNDVFESTAKVRLPTSRASSLKVMILQNEFEFNETFSPKEFLSGVAIGYSNVLKVENIETHGELQEGFNIVINDKKVGHYLYLGQVLSVDNDPTASLRSCSVKTPIDYFNLKYVFVRKNK